ncbi:hypothetical protein [Flagellimonas sp. 389]|uniref:hypothetical protein n=1 Tax=Flagellimonas sp. 389 TaxID=2835862 RepID=UPI002022F6E7|nr:hypothetical protein [Flagellimonas sp. 389]
MKQLIHISTVFILTIGLISCDRIKNKSEQVAEKVKEKTKSELRAQTQKVIDKIYPSFDHDKPDTENNKKRFKDFLKIEISPDVKNIYCFDDAIGIDADYMFAFNCNEKTSKKIVEVHNLSIDPLNSDNGFGMQHDFAWWDKERIENLKKYSWTDGNKYFKYYWYDKENEKAYFFDFDL